MDGKTVFVCDEITPELIALDEMLAVDDLTGFMPTGFASDEEELVEIIREITVDPNSYKSPNYQPNPNIPAMPSPDDDEHDDFKSGVLRQDEAIAMDAAKPGSKVNIGCNTTFANCQAKNPLLCPYHGAKLIEADIRAGLAQTIPNAVVIVKSSGTSSQAKGKNFSVSIKVPASQKLAAEKALDDFLNQPGIKSQGMKDWDPRSNEWSDFYDIDLLQANQAPQGGMANRAALVNSVGQSIGQSMNTQPPSQQQSSGGRSTTAAPAQTSPAATKATPASAATSGTKANAGQTFSTTNQTNQTMMPSGGVFTSFGIPSAATYSIINTLGVSGSALYWDSGYTKMLVSCPNPTVQQGQSLQDALGNSWNVQVNSSASGFQITPAQNVAATTKPSSKAKAPTTGQKPLSSGYQPLSDIADDRKFLNSMKGKAAADELGELEDLIDEKEQLLEQIDSARLAMSNGDVSDAAVYQTIIDYASGGLKDVDEKVLDAREQMNQKYNSTNCQPVGASCAQIKANLQAQGATFIPKALDNLESVISKKMQACRNHFASCLTEANDDTKWAKICDLVEKSLANYLSRAAIRSRIPVRAVDKYFFGKKSYYTNYGDDLMEDNYGMQSPALKEFRLCASTTDADRSAFAPNQSDWGDDCSFTLKKDSTFCTFIDYNTGGCYDTYLNSSSISKPSIMSLAYNAGRYVPWIRKMLQTGKPDLTLDRTKFYKMNGRGHDEIHAFMGCDGTKKSEDILKRISEFEFKRQGDARNCVATHAAELKKYGIKITYWDSVSNKSVEVPNP